MRELKQILLVEDEDLDVELTLKALDKCNLANEVVVARDGAEALEYLFRTGKYSDREDVDPIFVLLDLKLPRVNGLEVLAKLKSDPKLKNISVVILTSSRQQPDLTKAYELGANAYVVKPVDFTNFAYAVAQTGIFWATINESPSIIRKTISQALPTITA